MPINKWAWALIESVEMQLATSARTGIQLQAYKYRLEVDSEVQLYVSAIAIIISISENLSVNKQGVISKQCY